MFIFQRYHDSKRGKSYCYFCFYLALISQVNWQITIIITEWILSLLIKLHMYKGDVRAVKPSPLLKP